MVKMTMVMMMMMMMMMMMRMMILMILMMMMMMMMMMTMVFASWGGAGKRRGDLPWQPPTWGSSTAFMPPGQ